MAFAFQENVPLRNFTTFKIGGNARFFYEPYSVHELSELITRAKAQGLPWFVIGRGSNVLISDNGFPGLVIKLGKGFKSVQIVEDESVVTAGAGLNLPRLGMMLSNHGYDGFTYMCVIPGTVGGAVCINAGTTKEGEIKNSFLSAEVMTESGNIVTMTAKDMDFSHRYSRLLKSKNIVLSARFQLTKRADPSVLKLKIREVAFARVKKQPRNRRNCGSVFKNPPTGVPAGWYIEKAGLKGKRVGDAQVSYEHANWIVNLGSASAEDVKSFISHIQESVYEKFGVSLEREVIYVPEDVGI